MKYRIKNLYLVEDMAPAFAVQVRNAFGIWTTIKVFQDEDVVFARIQAEELLEKLQEE